MVKRRNLVTKVKLSEIAGVSQPAINYQTRNDLKKAMVGRKVDLDHPSVQAYLKKLQERSTRKAKEVIKKEQAREKIIEQEPIEEPTIDEPIIIEQKSRGKGAQNENKKRESREKLERGEFKDAGDDYTSYMNMPLSMVIDKFGKETEFLDWLKAGKIIVDIEEKQLKNAEKAGTLIHRDLVKKSVISVVDTAFIQMLSDGAKTISVLAYNMAKAGESANDIEDMTRKTLTKFMKPAKAKMIRVIDD